MTVTSVDVWSDRIVVHGLVFLVAPSSREPDRSYRVPPALRDDRGSACESLGWGSVGERGLEYVRAEFAPPDLGATMLGLSVTPHGRDTAVEITVPFSS